MLPLISVLCVTRNRPEFVATAIRIFESYSYSRKELIVIDDSDKGNEPTISGKSNVRLIRIDNGGDPNFFMGEKHNIGLREAQGEVFAYQDDDDFFSPSRLSVQLQPIALEEVAITGFARDYVVSIPACRFWKFLPANKRPAPELWLKDGIGKYRLGFHDGTAMFHRKVLRHGILHPPIRVRQKVHFLDGIAGKGERWRAVPNRNCFVYVRHDRNTWQFEEKLVLREVAAPWWLPADVVAFWRKLSA